MRDTDIVLRSSDDKCFRVSSKVLAVHSAFFRDLFSLHIVNQAGSVPIIDLPNADADALAATLVLLTGPHPSTHIPNLLGKHGHHNLIYDIWTIVDAYDLHTVLFPLSAYVNDNLIIRFIFACATGFESQAVSQSSYIIANHLDVDDRDLRLLRHVAPLYATRWDTVQEARVANLRKCEMMIRSEQPMLDRNPGFVKRCSKGDGCRAVNKYSGDFDRARAVAASAAIGAIRRRALYMSSYQANAGAVSGILHCDTCEQRLTATFAHAISLTLGQNPTQI